MEFKERTNLFKLTGEIRFNPAILFNDLQVQNKINKRMNEYGHSFPQTNPDGSLACVDPENKTVLIVNNQIVNFTIDQPKGFDRFNSRFSQISQDVLSLLDVDNCNRIGIRAQWMVSFDSEDEASRYLLNTGLPSKFHDVFPSIKLPGITLVLKSNDDKKQTNFGLRVETHQVIEIVQNVTKKNFTVSGIVIDIDVYDQVSMLSRTQINPFVKSTNNQFESYLEKALKLLE